MERALLLPNEKIVSTRKISILVENKFWLGVTLILLSVASFILLSIFAPNYLSLSGISESTGLPLGSSIFSGLPLLPVILVIVGFLYILYAELKIYFTEFIVTDSRMIVQRGIISKEYDILLSSKIEDVSVDIDIMCRLLGLGKVTIVMQQDSRPPLSMHGVIEPYKFQTDILKLIGKETSATGNGTDKTS